MIDEGHNFSSPSSNAVLVAQKLVQAERRWVISGTPAKDDLLGVEVDLAFNESPSMGVENDAQALRDKVLEQRKRFDGEGSSGAGATKSLGQLATHFLQVKPWAEVDYEKRADWLDHVYRNEDKDFKRRTYDAFSQCMKKSLQQLIIKTQPFDVERDLVLPPLTHRVVRLEPSFYDKLSANLFVLVLTANAITSERTDIDYLFHPRSQQARNQLITNLRQSNLFWTGFSETDVGNAIEHGKAKAGETIPAETPRKRARDSGIELVGDSPLRNTQIIGTVSAKLSYLLGQVMAYYRDEKILIFYDGDNAAYYIAQCLDLLGVPHEIYSKGISNELRSRYIVNFDKDPTLRVLLMDVRLGALGLNVNQASRVYFINPVCRPSIEAQAVKRAHRIGQTKPVYVETLILTGTIEEAMFERSKAMTRNEHMEAKTLEDDQKITDIIKNARLLPVDPEEAAGERQMAPLKKPEQLFGRPERGALRRPGGGHSPSSPKRRKKNLKTPLKEERVRTIVNHRCRGHLGRA
ncbi:SNF2-related protein [Neofusicoccum parvum]|uniref:SNF2-related protein n=1 Tax=Neofusicoccum parvum TaxID=310453 RepID=A0ACB5SHN0_9PEZI|nr:SNF2-related protein [Neofusicoccum parvum]